VYLRNKHPRTTESITSNQSINQSIIQSVDRSILQSNAP
jgi:hypothetical protein